MRRSILMAVVLLVPCGTAFAAPLTEKSLAPEWVEATAEEKAAWLAGFKFDKPDAGPDQVAKCLDDMAPRPPFATNELAGVTSMCETIMEKGGL
jgi:hypothetical protein